ncbi:MAG: class I SAM-dependent methyltransferase [Candidatus Eremiobacteraeota bacterium]|nr:class I SAM-dependent methyltransferase [Candidatus Eremiobacteraeota bacterium]
MAAQAAIAAQVGRFYESHPYPPPIDDLRAYARKWNDARRRAESHLLWPSEVYRDDRSILVAGCGTMQAARYAVRWPRARVVGIDVSAKSIEFERKLKRNRALDNLELQRLSLESAPELGQTFDHVVCTGVLHHLTDPGAGLRALRDVLAPGGAMHLMVYAPYGRAGVYILQEYCRRLGIGWSDGEIRDLAATLKALPADHPIAPILRNAPDFATTAGLADALLHPNDRAYSVPALMQLLENARFRFGRWLRQAPYLPQCGAVASTPHAPKLRTLTREAQYVAMELFRGTMVRHSLIAYRSDGGLQLDGVDFDDDGCFDYVPIRLPGTIAVHERLPAGAAAVLINRGHTYPDLYLPIDSRQERLLAATDGERTIAEIADSRGGRALAREFFKKLWLWDQVVFDTSRASRSA